MNLPPSDGSFSETDAAAFSGLIRSGSRRCPACGVLLSFFRCCWPSRRRARRNIRPPAPMPPAPAYSRQQRRLRARRLAPPAAEQRLPLRRLCALPDRQSRTGRRKRRCAAGPRRRCGRARMPATVLAFFANDKPASGNGWARLADAYAASGRMAEALAAARSAWASADLSGDGRAGDLEPLWRAASPRADHDRRVDALLFAKKPDDAARFYSLTSARAPRGLRRADRDAARCCRTPTAATRR